MGRYDTGIELAWQNWATAPWMTVSSTLVFDAWMSSAVFWPFNLRYTQVSVSGA